MRRPLCSYRVLCWPEPCEVIDDLYGIAERMKEIDKALAIVWDHLGAREAACAEALTDYDFHHHAKALIAIADTWQLQLDGETS